jgi:hypothetical protein
MLEERLRQTFATQAALVRAVDDPAGRAIARARVLRRRRTAGSGVAIVALLTLSLGTAVTLRAQWQPDGGYRSAGGGLVPPASPGVSPPAGAPPATAPPAAAPAAGAGIEPAPAGQDAAALELWVGDELWVGTGKRVALTGVGRVTRVHRVALGWVYGGSEHLRLLRPDGTSIRLASPGPNWLVSPDGARLAYARGRQLVIHRIGERGLGAGTAMSVPDGGRPVAFAGEQVVLSVGETGSFGLVDPAGPYRPAKAVTAVYGAAGTSVVGLVRDAADAVCLALLVPGRKGLTARRTGDCRPADGAAGGTDRPGLLAPGGGWLAEPQAGGTVLLDLGRAFTDGAAEAVVARCPVAEPTHSAWIDARTLVLTDGRRAMRCGTDGSIEPVALPAGLTGRWAFVPGEPTRR